MLFRSPERCAHFSLKHADGSLYKAVFSDSTRRILLEFLESDILVSIYDNETESVRQEIANQTGVSFQKATNFKVTLSADQLSLWLTLVDLVRTQILQRHWASSPSEDRQDLNDLSHFSYRLEQVEDYLLRPRLRSCFGKLQSAVGLKAQLSSQLSSDLNVLSDLGFIEYSDSKNSTTEQTTNEVCEINIKPLLYQFCTHFLLPDVMISLELSHPPYSSRELILQGGLKQAICVSVTELGYEVESLTGLEILSRIDAYLACPILSE